MLDVLMLTNNDWANSSYEFANCLRLLGLEVKFLKGRKNPGYPNQGEIRSEIANGAIGDPELSILIVAPELQSLAESANAIYFGSSTFVMTGVDLREKHVVVRHGGTAYRQEHQAINNLFNPFTDATIVHSPDLLGLGAKNEIWICNPVNTEFLQPDFRSNGPVRIGHFPSNPSTKGTERVLRAIETLEGDRAWSNRFQYVGIRHDPEYIDWLSNINRMKCCDVLIEMCNPKHQHGEMGSTALEASALGTVVVTSLHNEKLYEREYGKRSLHVANDTGQLIEVLKSLISLDARNLLEEKRRSREWVVKYHSREATAGRLWDKVYSRFYKEV